MEMKTRGTVIPKMYRGERNGGYKQFHGLKLNVEKNRFWHLKVLTTDGLGVFRQQGEHDSNVFKKH